MHARTGTTSGNSALFSVFSSVLEDYKKICKFRPFMKMFFVVSPCYSPITR